MAAVTEVLVRRFYDELWNRADEAVAREILDPDFAFRGSLGPQRRGPDGFIEYLRAVRVALEGFVCIVDDLIVEENRAAARMTFRGTHRGSLFGAAPTGRTITWSGAAFFTIRSGHIAELWVLGDVDAVRQQLAPEQPVESCVVKST